MINRGMKKIIFWQRTSHRVCYFQKILIYNIPEISCQYQRKSHIFSHRIVNFYQISSEIACMIEKRPLNYFLG